MRVLTSIPIPAVPTWKWKCVMREVSCITLLSAARLSHRQVMPAPLLNTRASPPTCRLKLQVQVVRPRVLLVPVQHAIIQDSTSFCSAPSNQATLPATLMCALVITAIVSLMNPAISIHGTLFREESMQSLFLILPLTAWQFRSPISLLRCSRWHWRCKSVPHVVRALRVTLC